MVIEGGRSATPPNPKSERSDSPAPSSYFVVLVRGGIIKRQNTLVLVAGSEDPRSPVLSQQSPNSAAPRRHLRARAESRHISTQQAAVARVPADGIVATDISPEIADPAENPPPPLHIHALCVKLLSIDCTSGATPPNVASAPIRAAPRFGCNGNEYHAGETGRTLLSPPHHEANLPAAAPPPGRQAACLATAAARWDPYTAATRGGEPDPTATRPGTATAARTSH